MELQTARALLGLTPLHETQPQIWADLGCGSGLFTQAIATQLPNGSVIHAIDRIRALSAAARSVPHIQVIEHLADFEHSIPIEEPLDGVVMANSLHFVKDQVQFLKKLKGFLKPGGKLLMVEYNTDRGNQWVPYPLSMDMLKGTCNASGFTHFEVTTHVNSSFGHAQIYGAVVA